MSMVLQLLVALTFCSVLACSQCNHGDRLLLLLLQVLAMMPLHMCSDSTVSAIAPPAQAWHVHIACSAAADDRQQACNGLFNVASVVFINGEVNM